MKTRTKVLIIIFFTLAFCILMINGKVGEKAAEFITENVLKKDDETNVSSAGQALQEEYTMQEILIDDENGKIYGQAYVPVDEKKDTFPLVILSHGLNNNFNAVSFYAYELAKHGFAVYIFDFRGGSQNSLSEGDMLSMSVMTEVADLKLVIEQAKTWDFVDTTQIIIGGEDQGGLVSAIVASDMPEDITGLIMLYPYLSVADELHNQLMYHELIPDTFQIRGGITLGLKYAKDVWDYDIYEHITKYTGPVLILHGDSDQVVDILYSEVASEKFSKSEFYIIEGGEHSFTGRYFNIACDYMVKFVEKHTDT